METKKLAGIELIAIERQEQIEKHGYSQDHDETINCAGELIQAAADLLSVEFNEGWDGTAPYQWDEEIFSKMMDKPYKERLIIAGALIAAEIDRLQVKG